MRSALDPAQGTHMHARSSFSLRTVLAAGLIVVAAGGPARAQQSLAPHTPPTDVAIASSRSVVMPELSDTAATVTEAAPAEAAPAPVGPTMDAASVAVRQPVTKEARAPYAPPRRAGYGQPVALMVVGGAALLAGLIIGDGAGYAIAVGGAVVGLYGLYEFLQ
jgi:hypothetical protein